MGILNVNSKKANCFPKVRIFLSKKGPIFRSLADKSKNKNALHSSPTQSCFVSLSLEKKKFFAPVFFCFKRKNQKKTSVDVYYRSNMLGQEFVLGNLSSCFSSRWRCWIPTLGDFSFLVWLTVVEFLLHLIFFGFFYYFRIL